MVEAAMGVNSKFVRSFIPAFLLEGGPLYAEGELPRKIVDQPDVLTTDPEVPWPRRWFHIPRECPERSVGFIALNSNMTVGRAGRYIGLERKSIQLSTPSEYFSLVKQHGPLIREIAIEKNAWIVEISRNSHWDDMREMFGYCCLMPNSSDMPKGTWITEKTLLPRGSLVLVDLPFRRVSRSR